MVELKRDSLNQDDIKAARLTKIFAGLRAGYDFHFLALQANLFDLVGFTGNEVCLLVAELEIEAFSRQVIEHGYGGLCGHYLLLNQRLLGIHHSHGQKLGTGFTGSRQCFYREINRDVDWIFTNRALKLKQIREQLLRDC
jgi:glycerophosphoryl diester phosphodiesterase